MIQPTKIITALLCIIITQLCISQTVFRGTVLDQETLDPVIGAKVGVVDQGVGEITNHKGNFTYRKYHKILDNQSTLKVTAKGYKTLTNDVSVIREMMQSSGIIYIKKENTVSSKNQKSKKTAIFWDASKKSQSRNITLEKTYLRAYLEANSISEVTLTAFNERVLFSEIFENPILAFNQIEAKLNTIEYKGFSDFEHIQYKNVTEVVLFSQKPPTLGTPYIGQEIPFHIVTINAKEQDKAYFKKIAAFTSGKLQDNISVTTETGSKANSISETIRGQVLSSNAGVHYAMLVKNGSIEEYYTNEAGFFEIPATKGDQITVYCLGHYTKKIAVTDQEKYTIQLVAKAEILDEVFLEGQMSKAPKYAFNKEKQTDKIGNRTVPVRTIYKEDFKKNATDIAGLINGWFGINSRIGPDGSNRTNIRGGCIRFLVDGIEVNPDQINISTIERITVFNPLGSVIPCPARIIITTKFHPDSIDQKLRSYGIDPLRNNIYKEEVPLLENYKNIYFDTKQTRYIDAITKEESTKIKLETYYKLKTDYIDKIDFYVDMTLYFQEIDAGVAALVRSDFAQVAGDNIKALRILAYLNEQAGAYLQAQKVYERILELAPSQAQSYRDLAFIYQETGAYNKSLELYINMLGDQIKGVDFKHLEIPISNELKRLVSLHKNKIDFTRLPNDWLAVNFNIDVRLTLDWSNPNTPFEFQFVDPKKKFYTWQSTNKKQEKTTLNLSEEFIIDDAASGKWLVNVRYTGQEDAIHIPPYLKYTLYKNFGTPQEKKQVKLVRLDTQLDKVTLDSFVY